MPGSQQPVERSLNYAWYGGIEVALAELNGSARTDAQPNVTARKASNWQGQLSIERG